MDIVDLAHVLEDAWDHAAPGRKVVNRDEVLRALVAMLRESGNRSKPRQDLDPGRTQRFRINQA